MGANSANSNINFSFCACSLYTPAKSERAGGGQFLPLTPFPPPLSLYQFIIVWNWTRLESNKLQLKIKRTPIELILCFFCTPFDVPIFLTARRRGSKKTYVTSRHKLFDFFSQNAFEHDWTCFNSQLHHIYTFLNMIKRDAINTYLKMIASFSNKFKLV